MENVIISFVIPVYNTEKYLKRNIESLLSIPNKEVEFIFIDDGSKDSSAEIIRNYMERDRRIKYYWKENGGLGSARNLGIRMATGKYISYVDSDDYIEGTLFATIIEKLIQTDVDVLEFSFDLVDANYTFIQRSRIPKNDELMGCVIPGKKWLVEEKKCGLVGSCVYKKSMILENQLLMPEGVIHEDMDYLPKVLWYADKYMYVDLCVYHYYMRGDSLVHNKNLRHNEDAYRGILRLKDFVASVDDKTKKDYYIPYIAEQYYNQIHIAIQNSISIRELYQRNEGLRQETLEWLSMVHGKKYLLQRIMVRLRWYRIYTMLYKFYTKIKDNPVSPITSRVNG